MSFGVHCQTCGSDVKPEGVTGDMVVQVKSTDPKSTPRYVLDFTEWHCECDLDDYSHRWEIIQIETGQTLTGALLEASS